MNRTRIPRADSATGRRERVRYINTVAPCKTEMTSIPFVLRDSSSIPDYKYHREVEL